MSVAGARLIIALCAAMLLLLITVRLQGYQAQVHLVESQRAGCERAKLDRRANAEGWRTAEVARLKAGEYDVASQYLAIADGLDFRADVDCVEEYRKPSILAFK